MPKGCDAGHAPTFASPPPPCAILEIQPQKAPGMFAYSQNDYYCEQVALADLAHRVGTPAYVYSAQAILKNYAAYTDAFSAVRAQAAKAAQRGAPDRAGQLRKLDPRERRLLELFRRHGTATAGEIAKHLGLAQRTVVGLCRSWLKTGFLELKNPSRKSRSYRDRKSTRLNSSHLGISYAVFCLKKK